MAFGFKKKKALRIRIYGDPVLHKKALPVESVNSEIVDFAHSLVEAMLEYDGVGLAATQVGVALRMIALGVPSPKLDDGKAGLVLSPGEMQLLPHMPMVFINPEIVSFGSEQAYAEEGCLSVPETYADVKRPKSILVKAQLLDSSSVMLECGGLLARAFQHEIDHLNGILFVDRLEKGELAKIKSRLDKILKTSKKRDISHN